MLDVEGVNVRDTVKMYYRMHEATERWIDSEIDFCLHTMAVCSSYQRLDSGSLIAQVDLEHSDAVRDNANVKASTTRLSLYSQLRRKTVEECIVF